MKPDFSGYATKANLKCSDGLTITPQAFQHMDGKKVPLVWQHMGSDPKNILGHALLEARADGVYAHCFFNKTAAAEQAKTLVQHGDINSLSIYANQLVKKVSSVVHGEIREVSLVLAGANPGAKIEHISLSHADGETEELEDEAIITTGLELEHEDLGNEEDETEDDLEHGVDLTVQDVYNSMTDEQKNVLHYMIGTALEQATAHSDDAEGIQHQEGNKKMSRNVFDKSDKKAAEAHSLSHEDVKGIVADAMKNGSLKEAVEKYALEHGIDNIEVLFPDAKSVMDRPEFDKRRTEWVANVLNGTKHTPFSRIKTLHADITHAQARAKGYIKGNMKKEEFFGVAKRVTTPTTIYKKQKLDRDDMIDITDFDIVAWLKWEMRFMLEEELARAILISDGREVDDEDKINELNIRPIAKEEDLYAAKVYVNVDDANSNMAEVIEAIQTNRYLYKGSGTPTFYTTEKVLTKMLLLKDTLGRRLYRNVGELADDLRVSEIVAVEAMEDEADLIGIIVNLQDYNIGADKGGEVNMFDDFDIDYNSYKYLIETRVSGALVKIRSALVIKKTVGTNVLAVPVEPTFDGTNVSIPTVTGVTYMNADADTTLANGSTQTLASGATLNVIAVPAAGYYFETSENDAWTFVGV